MIEKIKKGLKRALQYSWKTGSVTLWLGLCYQIVEPYPFELLKVLQVAGIIGILFLVSFMAGREGCVSLKKHIKVLDDGLSFVDLATEVQAISEDRLTRAKTLLMLECSRLPESSRKEAFKAEIEAL